MAARSDSDARPGWVFPPDAYDVTVAPGQAVQAAVDACPPDGCVLLLPGTHEGPLVLPAGKVVHVFGRGSATLRAATGAVVTSEAATSTCDGLIIRREAGGTTNNYHDCVWIKGGRLRLQACDVTSAASNVVCVVIEGGADPALVACKCVRARALSFSGLMLAGGEGGAVAPCLARGVMAGGRARVPRWS